MHTELTSCQWPPRDERSPPSSFSICIHIYIYTYMYVHTGIGRRRVSRCNNITNEVCWPQRTRVNERVGDDAEQLSEETCLLGHVRRPPRFMCTCTSVLYRSATIKCACTVAWCCGCAGQVLTALYELLSRNALLGKQSVLAANFVRESLVYNPITCEIKSLRMVLLLLLYTLCYVKICCY